MAKDKDDIIEVSGSIIEANRNGVFKVKLETGHIINATISGKIRKHNIKVLLGDIVKVEMSCYDLARGRITYRTR